MENANRRSQNASQATANDRDTRAPPFRSAVHRADVAPRTVHVLEVGAAATSGGAAFTHVIADLTGVAAPALRDATALTGLLIAAAGAAGLSTIGAPVVRQLPDGGVAAVLFLDACHITLRTLPESGTLLLDILAPASRDAQKALDVFTRRLAPKEMRSEVRGRG
jgi:S-adenosylmethionine decarboxylase